MVIFYVDVRIGNKTVGEIRNKFIYLIFSKTLKIYYLCT